MKALIASLAVQAIPSDWELSPKGYALLVSKLNIVSVFVLEKAEDLERYDALAFGSATEGEETCGAWGKML